ncbi:TonB-dependent receptor [Pedobacter aquatilis]|uniref:TonB-dependent receptor n=1 Tax=Pedobacter aquatilis TaxID=351343 RepID=UPI0025B2D6B8|nr:TonB-dependent receptor [Pedobacter aquatilis]MDN3585577.1 TonB-dependent receptor [Pedobacter aquatilis]
MKNFLVPLVVILLLFGKSLFAQTNCEVTGVVADSTKKAMSNITVRLYSTKDSLRTTTDDNGRFTFSKINAKQITIHISAVGFNTRMAKYTIKPDMQEIDLGTIILSAGEITLPDVIIKAKPVAIKYMQDTIEYDANAFNVQDDDRVSDLLKQLPGVEVDDDENVTAMGKSMTKLRVNGEDFFTNNVKDFISKLPAGIVAKIQVIDDFGDMANFTGIKVGEPNKMLNIVTKPGMNKGQFGFIALNGGTNRQIGGGANGNYWKGSKQISGGMGYNVADNGAGLSKNKNTSLSINDKINKNARFGANYNFNGNNNNNRTMQIAETVSELGRLNSRLENFNQSSNNGHNFGLNLNQTTKDIFVTGSASLNYNQSESAANSLNNQTGFIRQDFKNNSNSSNTAPNLQVNLDFSKKLNKNTFSGNFSFSNSTNKSNQDISTNTLYYSAAGILQKDSLLNRIVYNNGDTKRFNFGVSYSFLLKKDTIFTKSLSVNYHGSANITESDLQTLVLNPATGRNVKIDSLSIFTRNASINQSLSLNYNQSGKKNRMSAGLNISPNLIKNNYPELNSTFNNNYINISPSINYSKTISSSKSLSIFYRGQNSNPSIMQIQPVRNTRNLQNIVIGNPNLKSSFSNSLSASFNSFGKKSNISFMTGVSYNTIRNEIVNSTTFISDTLGAFKQETRFENANGNYSINGNYDLNIPFNKRKFSISLNGTIGNSRKIAIVNSIKTYNQGLNFSQSINGSMNQKKVTTNVSLTYSMSTNNDNNFMYPMPTDPSFNYNLLMNTGQSFFTTKSLSSNISSSLRLKNFRFGFNGNYMLNNNNTANTITQNINAKTQSFNLGASGNGTALKSWNFNFSGNKRFTKGYNLNNINPLIINLGVGKSFLKSKSLSCTVSVNDLLNEGNNISQSIFGNTIIESRNNQVMRVVNFGLNYNISTFGGKKFRLRTD